MLEPAKQAMRDRLQAGLALARQTMLRRKPLTTQELADQTFPRKLDNRRQE